MSSSPTPVAVNQRMSFFLWINGVLLCIYKWPTSMWEMLSMRSHQQKCKWKPSELPSSAQLEWYSQKGKEMLMEVQRGHSHCY